MASASEVPPYEKAGVSFLHHEGLESNLNLATEVLPGPPSLLSVQQGFQRRDLKKPVFSYLPATDPGTTYCGFSHGTTSHPDPSSDLSRNKGSVRAQRASARNQNGQPMSVTSPPPTTGTTASNTTPSPPTASQDSDVAASSARPSLSRSVSVQNVPAASTSSVTTTEGRLRRKDKGKAREIPVFNRAKEAPHSMSSLRPEPPPHENDEFCSACSSHGRLINCDGCPKSFHLWCLDPPLENVDEGDSKWFCPCCVIRKNPPRQPPPSLFSPLLHHLQTSPPHEYQLPPNIRDFFKDVGTGARGTFVDTSDVKHYRPNKFGQVEPRDPHRLRDRNGDAILCFRCGNSAMVNPASAAGSASAAVSNGTTQTGPADVWKSMISCDYCDLHWHLDCLDPPRLTMPSASKKFMCPNHAEKIFPSKRRIPRQDAPPLEVKKAGQNNNGNIEVTHPIIPPPVPAGHLDETVKYGRKFRVPEKVILLDFWAKVSGPGKNSSPIPDEESPLSSPLTSLSSLSDTDEPQSPLSEDVAMAELLCNFASSGLGLSSTGATSSSAPSASPGILEQPPRKDGDNVSPPARLKAPTPNGSLSRRKRPSPVQVGSSQRELRSKNRSRDPSASTSLGGTPQVQGTDHSVPTRSKTISIKLEPTESSILLAPEPSASSSKSSPRKARVSRTSSFSKTLDPNMTPGSSSRKRKSRDDDATETSDHERAASIQQANQADRTVGNRTPRSSKHSRPSSSTRSAPSTPSLKIRLPALSNGHYIAQHAPSSSGNPSTAGSISAG